MALPTGAACSNLRHVISLKSRQITVKRVQLNKRAYCQTAAGKHQPQRRIFSAIQPTGIPHLGNYFGALQNWVRLQNEPDNAAVFSIADMHSITLPQRPDELRRSIRDCVAVLLACGIDPERSILFQQSDVSQHMELAWILGCMTTLARLGQFPQWKAKAGSNKQKECVGLFTYPILQSADILIYKTTHVPIGDDQVAHLNLTQDLAQLFNNKFGAVFPIPKAIEGDVRRVKNLRNPDAKMSKSEPNVKSRIELTDSRDEIREKFKKAVTDFTGAVTYDPESRPGVSNLVAIHAAVDGTSHEEICRQVRGMQTGEYKLVVAEAVNGKIAPIRERIIELRKDEDYIRNVLTIGAERARVLADRTYGEVKRLVGLVL